MMQKKVFRQSKLGKNMKTWVLKDINLRMD